MYLPGQEPKSPAEEAKAALKKAVPVSPGAQADVCTALAQLFESGMSPSEALRMVAQNAPPRLKPDLEAVAVAIDSKRTLAQGLRNTETFRPGQIAVMEAFESIGEPGAGFRALASALEDKKAVRKQVIRGLMYPVVLLISYMIISPIPKVVIASPGAYGREVISGLLTLLVVGLALWFGIPPLVAHAKARAAAWKLPWPASIYRAHVRAVFCRTLAQNLGAGIELIQSLRSAAAATNDETAKTRLRGAEPAIQAEGLSQELVNTELVAKEDAMLVVSGEKSGNLVEGLERVGQRYTEARERGQKALTVAIGAGTTVLVMALVALSIVKAYEQVTSAAGGVLDTIQQIGNPEDIENQAKELFDQLDPLKDLPGLNAPRGG